jgi:hypothetical protein
MVGEEQMNVDDQQQLQQVAPGVSPYRSMAITSDDQPQPAETNFDYANPQRMFEQRRQQMLEQQGMEGADPTMAPVMTPSPVPSGAPGGTSVFPGSPLGATRPGEIVNPQQPPGTTTPPPGFNPYNLGPYGLPVGAAPGTGTTPQMEPDRSKYLNPYAPQPTPKPPDKQDD